VELRGLVERTTGSFEEFEFSRALEEAESFFWSAFTDNYLELVKQRARSEEDAAGRASAVRALRLSLSVLLRLFAPFVPTITEEVWSWAFAAETGERSIHISRWPAAAELAHIARPANPGCFSTACDAIAAVRKAKADSGAGMGRPVAKLKLSGSPEDLRALEPVLHDILHAANASSAELSTRGTAEGLRFNAEIQ
jgi:valyl-tRNA synthetase